MLEEYARKRDLERTGEPAPERRADKGPLTFVVQKHAARRLHYDLRLELGGALKSWAVPKGISLDPEEKRLAVMVEDHPIEYAAFEGVIPEGEYGAGEVIVWDNGTYSPESEGRLFFNDRREAERRMRQGLDEGKVSFVLNGRKLKGSWTLVKRAGAENDWLLIKHREPSTNGERETTDTERSVISGLTIEDLKAGRIPSPKGSDEGPAELPGAKKAPFPRAVEPMLATLTDSAFSHPDWLFEPKLDGIRAVCLIHGDKVRLTSRRGNDITGNYPALADELGQQPERDIVLDGEIVALDEEGRPSFQRLQQRINLTSAADIRQADRRIPVVYFAFDLLYLGGYDLRAAPLEQRKATLSRILVPTDHVRFLDHFLEEGTAAYEAAVEHGLEGVMAKRRDSAYKSGQRSPLWLKVKAVSSDEFVIGGYTPGEGSRRSTFGALLLGEHDEKGRLRYVGHVGSGFDERTLTELRRRLDGLKTDKPTLTGDIPRQEVSWVRPELVAEVKYAQRTEEGRLRAPVFLGLRTDVAPKQVGLVQVVPPPAGAKEKEASGSRTDLRKDAAKVLDQLGRHGKRLTLVVEGHRLTLTNLDKPLWPAVGRRPPLTKVDLLIYLTRVSPYLLPHLRDRPLTLKRYPDGIEEEHFFQKHWEHPLPEFVETVTLYSEQFDEDQEYLLCNNLPTLLWLAQLADIELHTWYSRINREPDGEHLSTSFAGSLEGIRGSVLNYPDFIVFDLDPYIYAGSEGKGDEPVLNRKAFAKTREVARWLREILSSLSLSAFLKTSGKTGLHIYVPILRRLDYDAVRSIAATIGRYLMSQHPREITMEWSVEERRGKVFFDHNQNARGKTLVTAYSPRALPEATVATPLFWEELDDVYPTDFTMENVPDRLAEVGDPWQGILQAKADLGRLLEERQQGRNAGEPGRLAAKLESAAAEPPRRKRGRRKG